MPTNLNMVAIQTVTVGAGGTSSIQFTSIPQTYTDLKIVLSSRDSYAAVSTAVYLQFNGSSASNYIMRRVRGSGSVADSYSESSQAAINLYNIKPGSSATANTFGNAEIYIPNYTSSNSKSVSVDGVGENNATEAYDVLFAGLWSLTSAITSITMLPDTAFIQYTTATLYGVTSAATGAKATGGNTITTDGTYWYHTFTSSGTFTPLTALTNVDYLVVAGGGGGGSGWSGGGGAGGLRSTVTATGGGGSLESALSLVANTGYTVTVGAGGAASGSNTPGGTGNNSVFSTITSSGGGYGGGGNTAGGAGGSGGGAGSGGSTGNTAGGAGTANQGYAGGNSVATSNYGPGGGGGAGAAGQNGTTTIAGNGGNGVATSISGSSVTYAGGGGGGGISIGITTPGTGGTGGGGAGANSTTTGFAGTANRGGGGGGGGYSGGWLAGGAGGSGIVIIRYPA